MESKSEASMGAFPYVFRFKSPTSKNKAITVITNAPDANSALQDVNPFFNVKSPFSNQHNNASFSSDGSGASVLDEPDLAGASSLNEPVNTQRTSSEDDQPEASPFHNEASKLRTAPPPVPKPRRVKTASDNDDQPFSSPFHGIQLPGVKRGLPPVPVKKEDDEHDPFKD